MTDDPLDADDLRGSARPPEIEPSDEVAPPRRRKESIGQTIGGVLFGFEQQVSSGAFPERRPVRNEDGSLAAIQGEAEFLRRGVPTTEKNMGELFRAAGYRTAVIGKWHLGHGPQFLPQNRGFDRSVVFYGNTSLAATRIDGESSM